MACSVPTFGSVQTVSARSNTVASLRGGQKGEMAMEVFETRPGASAPITPIRAQPSGFSIFKNSPCIWPESMSGQPGASLRVHIVDSDTHVRGVIAQELMGD